jgi:hypothetical protein
VPARAVYPVSYVSLYWKVRMPPDYGDRPPFLSCRFCGVSMPRLSGLEMVEVIGPKKRRAG